MSDPDQSVIQPEGSQSQPQQQPAPRTSGRTRNKSQRVLEIEDTKRYIRSQATGSASAPAEEGADNNRPSRAKAKGKGKRKVEEVYCICKKDSDGPMIECGECNDWFHFSCINLAEDEAEKIHKYVCPGCQQSTGQKISYIYDIQTFPSPSPPRAETTTPATRPTPKRKTDPSPPHSDEASEAPSSEANVSLAASDNDDDDHRPQPTKRPRIPSKQSNTKPRQSPSTVTRDRKPSVGGAVGVLPPMRKYVRDKLAPAVKALFGDMTDDKAAAYAVEVEDAMFKGFKEVVNGKETAGNKYKTQFNLLSSSIARGLRPELAHSIVKGDVLPAQVGILTSADLASEEQLEAMERAKQAVLEQTVKVKTKEEAATIRLGRDGFERVEDVHEKELKTLAQQEEAARFKAEEKARLALEDSMETKSPVVATESTFASPPISTHVLKRSISIDVPQSPLKQNTFAMTSAWGGGEDVKDDGGPIFGGNQGELDLSDIVQNDVVLDDLLEENSPKRPSEMELFEAKPIAWSGAITNPANPSPHTPPINLRLICRLDEPKWSILLPHKTLEITGRVPTKNSLQFLSDSRLSPGKQLVTVVFTLDPKASEEELKTWEELVEYHIGRDRHAIYLPYGNRPPPGAAKELYLIPLRPNDPSPEFTDLIDGYSLPSSSQRTRSVFLGVFVANKNSTPAPAVPALTPAPAISTPIPPTDPVVAVQNEQLQALMASLNPAALQGLLASTPLQGSTTPLSVGSGTPLHPSADIATQPPPQGFQPQNFPPFPPPSLPQAYPPFPPTGSYTPGPGAPRPYGEPSRQDSWDRPDERRQGRPSEYRRDSDQGWGSRRGRGREY